MAARTSSLAHPKYKTKYSVKNRSEYKQGLRNRGDVTIWFSEDAIGGWTPRGERSRGAQRRYSDRAIETALTLGILFHLPLRQTEGFVGSLLRLMDLDLRPPEHSTLSRRAKQLDIQLPSIGRKTAIHLVIDRFRTPDLDGKTSGVFAVVGKGITGFPGAESAVAKRKIKMYFQPLQENREDRGGRDLAASIITADPGWGDTHQ